MSAAPTAALTVDRLTLHAPGFTEAEARRFGALVGDALGRRPLPAGLRGTSPSVKVDVTARAGEPTERLAARVADAILLATIDEVQRS